MENRPLICYSFTYMHTLENAKLKALIKLLETESETYGPVLKGELAAAIKENPLQVQSFIEEEFKTSAPRPVLDALEEICWEDLATALTRFSAKINPDLEEGLTLLSKFTRPICTRGDIAAPLDEMARDLRPAQIDEPHIQTVTVRDSGIKASHAQAGTAPLPEETGKGNIFYI